MGRIALAAKVTHVPSLMLSEHEGPLKGTREGPIAGLRALGGAARERGVTCFVVLDTHWISNFGFHLNGNARHQGTYTSPEAPHMVQDLRYDLPGSPALSDLIAREACRIGPKVLSHHVPTLPLEYGTIVPMHYLNADARIPVVPVASPIFASIEELRRVGEAIRLAADLSDETVALLASGSMSHRLFDNERLGDAAWNEFSSEFNRQVDLRVLELWERGQWPEFTAMLPDYTRKCNGEALMADTVMLFGALGWDGYRGRSRRLSPYFPSSGSGQVVVEFDPPA